jgi:hypothetical protein
MYRTISNKIIRKFHPCYDPSKVITDKNEELPIKDWIKKYRNVVPDKDILWLLLREEFLSEKDLILFAVWCAREALKLIENPDERSVEACNVAERYANGEVTKEEFLAVRDADFNAARYAFVSASAYAARAAANAATAARAAANAATAARAVYFAAIDTVSNDAADAAADAAYDATYNATRTSQLDQLLTYFE